MKEFRKTNTVTQNLMSFTGFKSMLIFSELVKEPKSYEQLQDVIAKNEILRENLSVDALRVYINSLKAVGCDIQKVNVDGQKKYSIVSHPYMLKFSDEQIQSIIKVFKIVSQNIEVNDLLLLRNFFSKIVPYIENSELKEKLSGLYPLNNIDENLIKKLIEYTNAKAQIVIYYNSNVSGRKNIKVLTDKLYVSNNKLYISGYNPEHGNYSSFLVSKIINIVDVKFEDILKMPEEFVVQYKYKKDNNIDLELFDCERVISSGSDEDIIEITSKNKFEIIQRILSHSSRCTVLSPDNFRQEIILHLTKMKDGYAQE